MELRGKGREVGDVRGSSVVGGDGMMCLGLEKGCTRGGDGFLLS